MRKATAPHTLCHVRHAQCGIVKKKKICQAHDPGDLDLQKRSVAATPLCKPEPTFNTWQVRGRSHLVGDDDSNAKLVSQALESTQK